MNRILGNQYYFSGQSILPVQITVES